MPLSSPACDDAWRRFMAKRYSGNEFASVASATQCSSSARTAIADSATAAPHAVSKPAVRQRRCANSRHQQSPEGRLDHRDRQRDYRCRRRQAPSGVTDQGSLSITSPASFECGRADPARKSSDAAVLAGSAACFTAALPDLRPHRTLHRSVSTHSTKKVSPSHDQSGNPRADSPLLLRRTLEDRHHCQ